MGVGQLRIRNSESHHPSVRLSWLTFEWSSSSSGSGVSPLVLSACLGLHTSGRQSSARTAPVSCCRLNRLKRVWVTLRVRSHVLLQHFLSLIHI